jgi:hypothetical protein
MIALVSEFKDTTTTKLVVMPDRVVVRFQKATLPDVQARVLKFAKALRDAVESRPTNQTARGRMEFSAEEGLTVKLTVGNTTHVSVGRVREATVAADWQQICEFMTKRWG